MSIQLFELNLTSMVRVSGEDALPYLQSQLTIDFRKLPVHGTRFALRLSRKGKVLFGAQVIRVEEEEFLLICRHCNADQVIELLEENVVADDVEFAAVNEPWKEYVFLHPSSLKEILSFIHLKELSHDSAHPCECGWAFIDAFQPPYSLSLLTPTQTAPPWKVKIQPSPSAQLEQLRLEAGIFRTGIEIGQDELPQEGGLETIAVDFDKGCYLGQEVMARIHAMGKVRYSTVAVKGTTTPLHTSLPAILFDNGKKVGKLKSQFIRDNGTEWIGAAVIHENAKTALKQGNLKIENTDNSIQLLNS